MLDRARNELQCKASRLAYPIRDGIPVMLEDEAREMSEAEVAALRDAVPGRGTASI
ncbi:hypothetical protein BSY238_3345 [Methyloversatilis sp. RAC08]|nr:hypothetical protein BSY238_3345 [Methyloversatilis sp. RAC08]